MTTPENYPLSVHGLVSATNQRTSRDPLMELSEEDVRQSLTLLESHGLVSVVRDARVLKYEHRARTVLNLRRDETAVLCVLLLRGPQTPGELRSRAERMFAFDGIEAVQAALDRLGRRESPLTAALPRLPGAREPRWIHLLGDPAGETELSSTLMPRPVGGTDGLAGIRESLTALEERVRALEARLDDLEN